MAILTRRRIIIFGIAAVGFALTYSSSPDNKKKRNDKDFLPHGEDRSYRTTAEKTFLVIRDASDPNSEVSKKIDKMLGKSQR